ncbi:MAG: VOC family protein [Bdellovibrionales bacterium]|nr:VOC family protein [Bdellovibrionales bacterium]
MAELTTILESCLYARNLDSVERFYSEILGLTLHSKSNGRHLFYFCGNQMLLIFNPDATESSENEIPTHGSHGSGHLAFGVNHKELAYWKSRLSSAGISIEHTHKWPSGKESVYFRDPAGNSLEIAADDIWSLTIESDKIRSH